MDFNFKKINRLKAVITLILVILAIIFAYVFKDIFNRVENRLIDFRASLSTDSGLFSHKFKPADENIVILSINDLTQYEAARSSELNLTRWPWSRKVWADVINFLERRDPKMIIVDLNFSNYEDLALNQSSADIILSNTLWGYNNIILATALRTPYEATNNMVSAKILDNFDNPYYPARKPLNLDIPDQKLDNNISYYSHTPIPDIFTRNTTMAVTNLQADGNNGIIKYSQPVYKLIKGNKSYYLPSIPLAALIKYAESDKLSFENNAFLLKNHKIPVNEHGQVLINWHGSDNTYTDIPINAILLSMVRGTRYFEYDNRQIPLDFFKDKIILIAQTQTGTETHNTPAAQDLPDAQIKATIIDNYINDGDITTVKKRAFAKHLSPLKTILLTAFFCAAIIFVIVIATNMLLAFMNSFLLVLIYCWLSIVLFCHPRFHLILDMALPLYCMGITLILTYILKVHHEFKKRKKIEKIFGNLVSEKVLKQLINKPHKLNLKAGLQKVTIMSCNIFNNIEISDVIRPEDYIELINRAFGTIENIIFKYNGTINRFVGNSVLVYWGYPIHSRKDTENALHAALEIKKAIKKFNKEFLDELCAPEEEKNIFIDVKIAINTGTALIGQIGSRDVSDFTLLGDTVDIIEKIENVGIEFDKKILVTEESLKNLDKPAYTVPAGQIRIKNSDEKIKIFELKGMTA